MIEALIIDVDDTLCLTEADYFELENETLISIGRPCMSREVHVKTWGQPLFDAIKIRSPGIDIEAFKAAYILKIADYTSNKKIDTIPQANYAALDELIAMGKLLMILTSRTHSELKHLLEPDHLLASHIEAFYYKDVTKFHKPDPRVFDELLATHNLIPQNCAYVGDSLTDAIATKRAGLYFIASLESGLRQRKDFDGYDVDAFIDSFPEVVKAVAELEPA